MQKCKIVTLSSVIIMIVVAIVVTFDGYSSISHYTHTGSQTSFVYNKINNTLHKHEDNDAKEVPKVIYILWFQGNNETLVHDHCENTSHPLLKATFWSWQHLNPTWKLVLLTDDNLPLLLDEYDTFAPFFMKYIGRTALSDLIMLSILHKYGGLYVDADVLCYKSLEKWLYEYIPHNISTNDKMFTFTLAEEGEIAFNGRDYGYGPRVVSWFLTGHKDSYIINKWYNAMIEFWTNRINQKIYKKPNYFWVQHLWTDLYHKDVIFKQKWNSLKRIYAMLHGRTKCGPLKYSFSASNKLNAATEKTINEQDAPMFKIHYKRNWLHPKNTGTVLNYFLDNIHYIPPNCNFIKPVY